MNNKDADFSQMSCQYQFSKHRYRITCSHWSVTVCCIV